MESLAGWVVGDLWELLESWSEGVPGKRHSASLEFLVATVKVVTVDVEVAVVASQEKWSLA